MSLFQPFDLISKEPFHRRFALRYSNHWYTPTHKSFTLFCFLHFERSIFQSFGKKDCCTKSFVFWVRDFKVLLLAHFWFTFTVCSFREQNRDQPKNVLRVNDKWTVVYPIGDAPSITDGVHRKENFVEIIPVFSTFSKIFNNKIFFL